MPTKIIKNKDFSKIISSIIIAPFCLIIFNLLFNTIFNLGTYTGTFIRCLYNLVVY